MKTETVVRQQATSTRIRLFIGFVLVATGSLICLGTFMVVVQLAGPGESFSCFNTDSSEAEPVVSSQNSQQIQEALAAGQVSSDEIQEFLSSQGLDRRRRGQNLKTAFEQRKQNLLALARIDPAAASTLLLSEPEAEAYQQVSHNCAETVGTLEGGVHISHRHFDKTTAVNEITLQTEDGEKKLYVAAEDQSMIAGAAAVRVAGFSFADDEEFFAYYPRANGPATSPIEVLQPAVSTESISTEKLVILLGDFQNTNVVLPTVPETERIAEFSKQYFLENSYGQMTLDYHVSGMHEMAMNRGDSCPFLQVAQALVDAADPVIDFSQYHHQRLAIFAPFKSFNAGETTDPGCKFSAIATTSEENFNTDEGTVSMTVAGYRSPLTEPMGDGVLHHELAHNMAGAGHANWAACPAGVTFFNGTSCKHLGLGGWNQEHEYEDTYDTLGAWSETVAPYQFDQGHFSAPRKDAVGWFEGSNVATVHEGGLAERFVLEPIERSGPGLKTVKIERGPNQYLYVEYRQPNFADGQQNLDGQMFSTVLPNVFNGALFHTTTTNFASATHLLDATPNPTNDNGTPTLPVGQTLTDPHTGATVTVVSKTPDALTIDVTPPRIDSFPPPPPAFIHDGLGDDEDVTTSTTSLSANWAAVIDAGSGVDRYEYVITDELGNDIVALTSNGAATSVTVNNLSLTAGKIYSFWVRSVDRVGNIGELRQSDGIIVTGTQPLPDPPLPTASTPRPPTLVVDGFDLDDDQDYTGRSSILHGTWNLSPDRNTNVSRYQYAIGTTAGGTDVVDFTNIDKKTTVARYGLSLQASQTYYLSVRAVSLDGTTAGPTRSSDGITLDASPPPGPGFVYDGLGPDQDQTASLNTLKGNWAEVTDDTGVYYQYAIGSTPGAANIMTYSDAGSLGYSFIQGGLQLTNNTTYYMAVRAIDGMGNVGQPTISDGILTNTSLDTQPPSVTMVTPTNNATVYGNVTLAADASDDYNVEGVQFLLNGSTLGPEDITAPYGMTWNATFTTPGAYTLTAMARDAAGRKTISTPITVTVLEAPDTSPPIVAITSPTNNQVVSGNVNFSGTSSDNKGVLGVQLKIDGVNAGTEFSGNSFSYQWNTLLVCNGYHSLSATARDGANNQGTSSLTVRVANPPAGQPASCDKTAPPAPTSVYDGLSADLIATISVSALSANWTPVLDSGSGLLQYEYAIGTSPGGSELIPFTAQTATTLTRSGLSLTNGQIYYTSVRARDVANNVSTTTSSNGITVDTVAPTFTAITSPISPVTGMANIDVTASDNLDIQRVEVLIDNVLIGTDTAAPYSISWDSRTVSNGTHTISAKVYDHPGQIAAGSRDVSVNNPLPPETVPPIVTITAPLHNSTVLGTVAVTATATDNVGVVGVQFKLDGANLQAEDTTLPYSVSWDTINTPNGFHVLTAIARDAAGNAATQTRNITVRNDLAAPTVAMITPRSGVAVSGVVQLTANASDDVGVVGVQFYLAGNVLSGEDTSYPYTVEWDTTKVANGPYVLTAQARDASGKKTTSAIVSVTVDNATAAPDLSLPLTIHVTSPIGQSVVKGQISLSGDVSGQNISRVEFYHDQGTLIGSVSSKPYVISWDTTKVVDGVHTLYARAVNDRETAASPVVDVIVENKPAVGGPELVLTVPSQKGVISGRSIKIEAEAEGHTITDISFYVDTKRIAIDRTSPFTAVWDSRTVANGKHSIKAIVKLANGQQLSRTQSFQVKNTLRVMLATPKNNRVKGRYVISPVVLGGAGIKTVEFRLDNKRLTLRSKTPFKTTWDSRAVRNGNHTIQVKVTDRAKKTTTTTLKVKVRN